MKQIKRIDGTVIGGLEGSTIRELVEFAVKKGTSLEGANLNGTDLEGANLAGADLEGAWLKGANLRGAKMHGASLIGVSLKGANLEGANLTGVISPWGEKTGETPIFINSLPWQVIAWGNQLTIGCQSHSFSEWGQLTKDRISSMHPYAMGFWEKYREFLLGLEETQK